MSNAWILPEELISEIFSWLPVKSLIRFRCVSKALNSLTFNPNFIKLHFQRSPKNTHLFLTFSKCEPVTRVEDYPTYMASCSISRLLENPSSTMDDSSQRISIGDYYEIGTCKGLVCLGSDFAPLGLSLRTSEYEEFWVRFFNPVTRVMSQDSPRMCLRSSDYKIGRNNVMFGFGYDDSSDTCKVLAVFIDIKSQQREFRVHNLGGTCWRKTLTCPAIPFLGVSGQFVYGTVNWLALCNLNYSNHWYHVTNIDQLVIFSYDLKNETYRYLAKPAGIVELPRYGEPLLGVLKGCLCISYYDQASDFVLWLMRDLGDENSWTRLLKVSLEDLQIPQQIHTPPSLLPFCMSENEDVLLLHGFYGGGDRFILYNMRDNRMDSSGEFIDKQFMSFNNYDQSLSLPY